MSTDQRGRERSSSRLPDPFKGLLGVVAFLVAVELWRWGGAPGADALPWVHDVVWRLARLLSSTAFWGEIAVTAENAAIGLALALVVGIAVGALLATSRLLASVLAPPLELVRCVPALALAPLLLQIHGRGTLSRALAVAFACTWPILFNTLYGLRSVDPVLEETSRSFGLRAPQRLLRVRLPSMAPFVFTGVRVSLAIAVVVEIGVEILLPDASRSGLGGFIALHSIGVDPDHREAVFAATLAAGGLGLALSSALTRADRRLFAWREAGR